MKHAVYKQRANVCYMYIKTMLPKILSNQLICFIAEKNLETHIKSARL